VGKLWIPHHFSFPLVVEPGIDKLAEEYRDIGGILGILGGDRRLEIQGLATVRIPPHPTHHNHTFPALFLN
jgi:hypothetical protein